MPLYEYECDAHQHRFEVIQKFSDPPVAACPSCGGSVHKLIASPAFQFKGTGWYITDYAKKESGSDTGKSSSGKEPAPAADKSADATPKADAAPKPVPPPASKPES